MNVLKTVKGAIKKRAIYQRTKFELENMPRTVAIDLGMFREDAAQVASKAVYGH